MAIMRTSYELDADTVIWTKRGLLYGIKVITDGTNDATAIIYDVDAAGNAAAANKVAEIKVAGGDFFGGVLFPHPLAMLTGCYVDITGTGATYIVYHRKG